MLISTQQFTYLGITISSDAEIDKEIDNRLSKTNSSLSRLCTNLKSTRRRSASKRLLFSPPFSTAQRPGDLPQSHPTTRSLPPALSPLHLQHPLEWLWSSGAGWNPQHRRHATQKYQFWWAGHVSRMEDNRLPKIVLYGKLSTDHRGRGVPRNDTRTA